MKTFKIKTKKYNTDTGSARVKAWVTINGASKTNSIPYPYEMNRDEQHKAAAVALVKKLGWDGRFDPDGFDGSTHVFYRE